MTTAMLIAIVILWILVLALALVVWALARQIGVLYERVAPAGALMVNASVKVGDPAPEMTLDTLTGEQLTVGGSERDHAQLLFFLAPDCPICKSLLPVLKSMARRERDVDIVLASDGSESSEHQAYVADNGLDGFPYLLSELLGRSYGVSKLPYAVLIRANGTLASLGIVNSREHLESLFEAEARGVASIQEFLAERQEDALFVDATRRKG